MTGGPCPDARLLHALLEGGQDAETEAALVEHVDACEDCRARLSALPGGSEWTAKAPAPGSVTLESPAREHELIGEFRILREVGRGGMGVVYEAEQASLGRRVALKVLHSHGLLDRTLVERFKREAHAAAKLHHTNIVPVHGAGEQSGLHYYAMEFIEGQGLDRVIRDLREHAESRRDLAERVERADGSGSVAGGRPSPSPAGSGRRYFDTVATLVIQAADALAYAHSHGVVHRDIKPSNLLLDSSSTLWIADFGLARADGSDRLTETGDVLGTLGYIAPERFNGVSDRRGDIYGLGVTLYELLTLRPAFAERDRHRLIKKISETNPTPPRAVDPTIPRDLETIVLRAIEKEPESRYQDASLLADDLRCFLLDRPIRARRATVLERTWRWCRRNRLVASLIVLACVVSIIAVAAGYRSMRASEAHRLSRIRNVSDQHFYEAQRLFGSGQYDEALESVKVSLGLRSSSEGLLLKARLLFELGRHDESAALLQERLRHDPDDGAAHYLLAAIYREDDSALSRFHQTNAERLLPGSAEAFHLRALAASSTEDALRWLDGGLDLDPSHYQTRKTRALMYYSLGRYAEMEADSIVLTSLRKADAASLGLRAVARARRGKLEQAKADLDRAIALDTEDTSYRRQRRAINRQLGDAAAELEDARHIAERSPHDDATSRFHLTGALLHNGLVDEAVELYADASSESWSKKRWFERSLARQTFQDLDVGVRFSLPESDGREPLETLRAMRDLHRDTAARGRLALINARKASWAPDGRRLAYDSILLQSIWTEAVIYPGQVGRRSIRVADLVTGEDHLLVEDAKDAAWAPDGRHVAFVREGRRRRRAIGPETIWIVSMETGEERKLAPGGYPTWSNDPNRLYFHSRRSSTFCEIDLTREDAEPRAIIPCRPIFPAISPDGKFVAFTSSRELRVFDLSTLATVASWKPPLVGPGLLVDWSPDGRELSIGCADYGDNGLWIYNRELDTARLVARGPSTLGVWSRDGRRFAWTIRAQIFEVWTDEIDPSRPTWESFEPVLEVDEFVEVCEREARAAIERLPSDPERYRRLARILEESERHGEAAKTWLEAYRLSSKIDSDDLGHAASCFNRAGDVAAAITVLEDCVHVTNSTPKDAYYLERMRDRYRPRFASFASLDDATLRGRWIIPPSASWRVHRGREEPPADWKQPHFDDAEWESIAPSMGYGREGIVSELDDMRRGYSTLFLRGAFSVASVEQFEVYSLRVRSEDAFVVFVNGAEVARCRTARGDVEHDDIAALPSPSVLEWRFVEIPPELVRVGKNVVAVVALNDAIDARSFSIRCNLHGLRPFRRHPIRRELGALVARTRRALAGDLPEDGAEGRPEPEDFDRKLAIGVYLLGRGNERIGKHGDALDFFRQAAELDPGAPEPRLRAAKCLRAMGEPSDARDELRDALESCGGNRRPLWELWWELSNLDLKEDAAAASIQLPDAPADESDRWRIELDESLRALSRDGALRINCGGETHRDASGRVWLADRFYTRGYRYAGESESYGAPSSFRGEISGTENDVIYRDERWFPVFRHHGDTPDGYRIPLPPGRYELRLHFAELVSMRAERRVFQVLAEGEPAVVRIDPFAEAGYATALVRECETTVEDGFLDIELVASSRQPQISAIEIRPAR